MLGQKKDPEIQVLKESVRYNEKGIDRVESQVKTLSEDFKTLLIDFAEVKATQALQTRLITGVLVIVLANIVVNYLVGH